MKAWKVWVCTSLNVLKKSSRSQELTEVCKVTMVKEKKFVASNKKGFFFKVIEIFFKIICMIFQLVKYNRKQN